MAKNDSDSLCSCSEATVSTETGSARTRYEDSAPAPTHVLVIAPNWIGDALMAQPLLMLLKALYPNLTIDVLAPQWVAPVLERMPQVNQVHATNFAHRKLQLRDRWQLARTLRRWDYDRAYVLPNSAKSALIPWLAGIRLRIGYHGEHRYGLLNVRHPSPHRGSQRSPMIRHYAALAYAPAAAAGICLPNELAVPHLVANRSEAVPLLHRFSLGPDLPLIALCVGAEYGSAKRWPAEHFAALAQLIKRHFANAQIIVLGSNKEAPLADVIVKHAPFVHNLCGKTTLSQACVLIAHAHTVVSNDSGLMHIAAALHRPLIAIFGSSDPRHTPPLSSTAKVQWLHLECSPCFARECPLGHLKCLWELRPEQVFEQLKEIMGG